MKNKSIIFALVTIIAMSLCFNVVAYGGETPIIPIPTDNTSSSGDTSDDASGDTSTSTSDGSWETPSVDIKEPVAISKCKFSAIANKVYSGDAFTPAPTVKYNGKTLKKGTDYTLKYAANKNVGTATITVTGKGDYTGSKKITFKINPKSTSLSKVTSPKKAQLKAVWKKLTTQTTGYQIQYTTDKDFKTGNKTVTVTSNKTTAKTVTKLKSKKKYYVRVRTYKTVNGTKYYSSWSKSKWIKLK